MFSIPRGAKRFISAGLLAGLCFHAAGASLRAQAPIIPDRTVQPAAPDAAPDGKKPDDKKKDEPKPFWATVPELSPPARPGWFLLPPSGSGYYTGLDALRGECKDKAPFYPYRGVFYDNDFRYLDTKDGKRYDAFDDLKRIHLGPLFDSCNDDWLLSVGGEERLQFKQENGGNNGRITGADNNYQLLRSRVYGDLWYKDLIRVYVEYIDAESYNQNLPPLAIDVNHSDILNAFADIKVGEFNDHPAYARLGRQELLYGSQRLVSPLDWANTRRTFDGAKVFWHGDKLDVDAFWVRPVVPNATRFDSSDDKRQFGGVYTSYRPVKNQAVDLYYFYLDDASPQTLGRVAGGRGGYEVNTFGARYSGDHKVEANCCCGRSPGSLLWDFEGGYQFGDYTARNDSSGFATGGVGWAFTEAPMQPEVWAYYDYASGTPGIGGTGQFSTFNQLFPFGHYYFGFLDDVGRENIHDLNFQGTIYPTKWITGLAQVHFFQLDQPADALYGTGPNYPVVRRSVRGNAGTTVGNEIDFVASFQLDRHSNLSFGYSKLFEGDFIRQTGPSVSPEFYYAQYSFRW
jgi:Alginate export